ncbi:hypothetical protein M0638_03090 [Roseomonas sp. NAR14]|uniref:Protein ImuA n=1 Tax=Roseomonas acroporae TaxID=2937791 RepID=A0A9X1Y4Y1_9PROT|nr:hypothetical protein [Roseomonas acroporae]MCK8783368.1 hypothetical protein [Roseomonas acroporae]
MPPSPPTMPDPMDRPALLAALRGRIARLERAGAENALARRGATVPLCPAIDRALPGGGLARAALHAVSAADPGAATGFCALLLARAAAAAGAARGGSVLWIADEPDAWPPGLLRFGLSPADLVLVRAPRAADGLWAMEEALRCPAVAGALLVARGVDPAASRRLQQAAEAGGALGLLLQPRGGRAAEVAEASGNALTAWRVEPRAGTGGGHALGDPRWHLSLRRCRGGRPGEWTVVWRAAQERLEAEGEAEAEVDDGFQAAPDALFDPGDPGDPGAHGDGFPADGFAGEDEAAGDAAARRRAAPARLHAGGRRGRPA